MFTVTELIHIGITIVAIGFIFSGYIKKPRVHYEDLFGGGRYHNLFNWGDIKFSTAIVAPAIILHELAHKFAGFTLGYASYYEMFPMGLGLGVLLRVIGSSFLLFAPGYVVVPAADVIHMGMIAFAGPATNLVLFFGSWWAIESGKFKKHNRALWISKQINLWLFIFNMIPFGPLDGAKVLRGVLALI